MHKVVRWDPNTWGPGPCRACRKPLRTGQLVGVEEDDWSKPEHVDPDCARAPAEPEKDSG